MYCAATIQKTCENEPNLKLRIGIHEGEVVFEGDDVFGDGVNIASRLEPLAPIGGILVSESVHRNLGNKKGIVSTFIREEQLKNVKEPIKIYSVQVEGVEPVVVTELSDAPQEVSPKSNNPRKIAFAVAGVLLVLLLSYFLYSNFSKGTSPIETQIASLDKSIVVLPFTNMSTDPDQDYFSDGMMEEILNHLVKIKDLKVVARTTAMKYKGTTKTTKEIARDLGVATVLEGSVRKEGDRVQITVRLIEGTSNMYLFSESYDRQLSSIFEVQSEVALEISRVLQAQLTSIETGNISKSIIVDTKAYDNLLKARGLIENWNSESDIDNALRLLQASIDIDPQFGASYAEMANILFNLKRGFGVGKAIWVDSALVLANKAIELDASQVKAYLIRSKIYYQALGNSEKASLDLNTARAIAPNDPEMLVLLSQDLIDKGNYQEGAELDLKAIDLRYNRNDPEYYEKLSFVYKNLMEYDNAIFLLNKAKDMAPDRIEPLNWLGLLYWHMGNHTEAFTYFEEAWKLSNEENTQSLLWMAEMTMYMGDLDQAEQYFHQIETIENSFVDSSAYFPTQAKLMYIYKLKGEEEKFNRLADVTITELKEMISNQDPNFFHAGIGTNLYHLAEAYAVLGQADEAIKLLENPIAWDWAAVRAGIIPVVSTPFLAYWWLENIKLYDSIREDEGFKTLIAKKRKAHESYLKAMRPLVREKEMNWEFALEQNR